MASTKVGIIVNDKVVEVFDSIQEAAKELNVTRGAISLAIHEHYRVHGYRLEELKRKEE